MSPTPFWLSVPDLPNFVHEVVRFSCDEAISTPLRVDVEVRVDRHGITPSVGQRATLSVRRGARRRDFGGVVTRRRVGGHGHGESMTVHLRIESMLVALRGRRQSRVFQEESTVDVVSRILGEHGIRHRFSLLAAARSRGYVVQHRETDLAFVARLLAEDGLAYFLRLNDEGDEEVVVIDSPLRYDDGGAPTTLRARASEDAGGALGSAEDLAFDVESAERTAHRGEIQSLFDLGRPGRRVVSLAGNDALGTWSDNDADQAEYELETERAAHRLEQRQRKAKRVRAGTQCLSLAPGGRFGLVEHPRDEMNRGYAVMRLAHRGSIADDNYRNELVGVADDRLFRPARPSKKPRQVTETATVVGPDGQEIHVDALGRVQVRFHWEDVAAPLHATCYLRVLQPWAGPGFGTQFVPRVGMEVLVTFLGGDPGKPVVLGALYNGENPVPFALPEQETKSGIVTRSTPGGRGHNELSFDDHAGAERVFVRAQRDLGIAVLNDKNVHVGGDATTDVSGKLALAVGESLGARVGGPSTVALGGVASIEVHGASHVRLLAEASIEACQGRRTVVEGNDERTVRGEIVDHVEGNATLRAHRWSVVLGEEDAPGVLDQQVVGSATTQATGPMVIASDTSIELRCGENVIAVTPEGIEIRGKLVKIQAPHVEAVGDGPALELTNTVRLVSDTIRLLSASAELSLGNEAKLIGDKVRLNPKRDDATVAADGTPRETRMLDVRVTDERYQPLADRRYEVRVGGLRLEGTTDGEGRVRERVPANAMQANIQVYTAEYPTGPRRELSIELAPLPSDAPSGLKHRLRNLGYGTSTAVDSDALDDATRGAIRDFQKDHELELTAELDEPTKTEILRRHGS